MKISIKGQGKSDLLILLNRGDCMDRFDCKYLAMVYGN